MKTNVIGDKSSFAIEFAEIIPDWGPPEGAAKSGICAIWLAGHKLHEEGNTLYLDGLLPDFQCLVNAEVTTGNPLPATTSANELLLEMEQKEELTPHVLLYTGGFDDFLTLFSKGPEYTTFLWAVRPIVAKFDEYRHYPKDVQKVLVKNEDIRRVVEGFADALKAMKEKPVARNP